MIRTKEMTRGGDVVCKQLTVLKRLRKQGKIEPDMIDLAEAQAKDYVEMNKRLTSIESKVAEIQNNQTSMREEQIAQGAKLDLIIQRLNSPAEAERIDGAVWREIKSWTKSWKFWALVVLIILAIAFAGPQFGKTIIEWVPTGA